MFCRNCKHWELDPYINDSHGWCQRLQSFPEGDDYELPPEEKSYIASEDPQSSLMTLPDFGCVKFDRR